MHVDSKHSFLQIVSYNCFSSCTFGIIFKVLMMVLPLLLLLVLPKMMGQMDPETQKVYLLTLTYPATEASVPL